MLGKICTSWEFTIEIMPVHNSEGVLDPEEVSGVVNERSGL
jgi:hypothetical protein